MQCSAVQYCPMSETKQYIILKNGVQSITVKLGATGEGDGGGAEGIQKIQKHEHQHICFSNGSQTGVVMGCRGRTF